MLGVLRQVDDVAPRDPTPGLDRMDSLVSRAEAAGLRVRTEVEGGPRPLPAGVDLAAFRIVQEALTNVDCHGGASNATVRVTYGHDDLTVEVVDDGKGLGSATSAGTGSGIAGMPSAPPPWAVGSRRVRDRMAATGSRARLPLEEPS